MDLDQIEELIRRYLAAGVAVVVILVGPVTGADADPGATGRPGAVDRTDERGGIRDGTPGADGAADPTGDPPADGTGDPAEPAEDAAADDAGGEGGSEEDAVGGDAVGDSDSGAAREDEAESGGPTGDDAAAGDAAADDGPTGGGPAGDGAHEDDAAGSGAAGEDAAGGDAAGADAAAGGGPADAVDAGAEGSADADREPPARPDPGAAGPGSGADSTADPATRSPDGGAAGEVATAAERFGWGRPERVDEFRSADLAGWEPYTGPGYRGRGQRSPDALAVDDGVLTISGDARGTTGGLCWSGGQRYGRWEARVRAPAADPAYHALLLLWPDADDFPTGGQVAFLELTDPERRSAEFYLHHGGEGDRVRSEVRVDATRWRTWAVDWTPDGITGYVDGEEWFSSTDPATLPPGPMHLCVQLDFFPVEDAPVRPSRMEVDWVRQYAPATPTGPPPGGGGPVRLPN